MRKKTRFDFYKALQAAQFHAASVLDAEGAFPEPEVDAVLDFIRKLRTDLDQVEARLLPRPMQA